MSSDQVSAPASTTEPSPATIRVHVKGPSDTKLTLSIATSATVLELKQAIAAEAAAFPVDAQRLIYSGRVLKDEDDLEKYKLKDGHSIHLVCRPSRGTFQLEFALACRVADVFPTCRISFSVRPVSCNAIQVKGAPKTKPSGTPGTSAAAGVPANFAAGQQVMGNPLAPLLNAENAGHFAGFNPFAEMGVNPNDPNYMQTAMQDPAVQQQMNNLLSNPAVIDQIIASNPELQAMGPQVRQIMHSEQFRSFLTNPEAMQQMASMMGGGGAGGAGGFPPPGAFGWGSGAAAQAQGQQAQPAGGLFNPWASTPPVTTTTTTTTTDSAETTNNVAAAPPAAGAPGAFNPFAAFGGGAGTGGAAGAGAGGQPNIAQMMAQMQALQQMGMGMGFGGNGAGAAQSSVPPEERFQTQLAQLQGMGFYDASKNIRALLASGGNVEAAIEYLFSNP